MYTDVVRQTTQGDALSISLDLRASGIIIDNITNQWLYEDGRRRFIPPYQAGVTIPLPGIAVDSIRLLAPGQTQQQAPIPGEFWSATYVDYPIIGGSGVNVGSFTAPPPVLVTDLQQENQPAPPAAGVTRVWADLTGALHRLLANNTDAQIVDESLALGGVLTGHLPNPGLALPSGYGLSGGWPATAVGLQTLESYLASSVAMTNANTQYAVASFNLSKGVWLIIGRAQVATGATAGHFDLIMNAAIGPYATSCYVPAASVWEAMTIAIIATLTGTAGISLNCQANVAGGTIGATSVLTAGPRASGLTAVQVG